jgi:hypothetical protein
MASPYFPEDMGEEERPLGERAIRVRFSEAAYRTVLELAGAQRSTMAEVMREALSVYWWLAREHSQGSRFLVQRGCVITEAILRSVDGMAPLPVVEGAEGRPPVEQPWGEGYVVAESSDGREATA